MEFLKSIIKLIMSFFENKKAALEAETAKTVVIEEQQVQAVRASVNAKAVEQQEKVSEVVQQVQEKQVIERTEQKNNPDDDKQFGEEW